MATTTLRNCVCARNTDGSRTTLLCSVHADTDPCLTTARVTGRRRKGSIKGGVCSSCGHGALPYDEAEAAYDQEDQSWFDALPRHVLVELWALCCDWTSCPSWDDEVFDALAKLGHFDDAA